MRKNNIILTLVILILGFTPKIKYPHIIEDFRPNLQNVLENINYHYEYPGIINPYLVDSCSKSELIKLLNCNNPKIRLSSFLAIVKRKEPDTFKLLLNHLDDTAIIFWTYEDIVNIPSMVSDLMINEIHRFSPSQKDSLVDFVVKKHIYLNVAVKMLRDIKPQDKYYLIIRKQSQLKLDDYFHLSFIYALAKYKRQKDLQLIQSNFKNFSQYSYLFEAIEIFPDSTFFPYLVRCYKDILKYRDYRKYSNNLKYYCRAVAAYKNEQSLKILSALSKQDIFPNDKECQDSKKYVFKAIHKYSCGLYDNLYKELKPQMDDLTMENLGKTDYDDELVYW